MVGYSIAPLSQIISQRGRKLVKENPKDDFKKYSY